MTNNIDTASPLTIRMSKEEQAAMVNGLRRQALGQIRAVALATARSKAERFDRIEQILEAHVHDVNVVLHTPTVD